MATVIDNLSEKWQQYMNSGGDLNTLTGISEGDLTGELHVLLTTGDIFIVESVSQDLAMMWCDWLTEDDDEDVNDYGDAWTNFNPDLVVAFDWVKYGSSVEHMF